jgi:hypothetical protein
LLKGLEQALKALKQANCPTVYLNGSFVTARADPNDYDVTWEMEGFDVRKLDPVFSDYSRKRAAQKQKYGGEFFPVRVQDPEESYLDWFQRDKHTKQPKGIVAIDLRWFK